MAPGRSCRGPPSFLSTVAAIGFAIALCPMVLTTNPAESLPDAGDARRPHPPSAELRFGHDGRFKLIQLTDLHLGEDRSGKLDRLSAEVVKTVLDAERDGDGLILLTGDIVSGYAWDRWHRPPGFFADRIEDLLELLRASGRPFAAVLGNHDSEADASRAEAMRFIASSGPNSLSRLGPGELPGAGNYWLDVKSSDGSEVAARVWFLDSGSKGCHGSAGWGCVQRETVEWMRRKGSKLRHVPSVAVMHIPSHHFMFGWNSGSVGVHGEPVNCPGQDTGLHEAFKEVGVSLVLSGHDHDNNFATTYDGVTYAYGQKTGYGSYGPKGMQRGARIVQLEAGQLPQSARTWIRLESGEWTAQAATRRSQRSFQLICHGGGGELASVLHLLARHWLVTVSVCLTPLGVVLLRKAVQRAGRPGRRKPRV